MDSFILDVLGGWRLPVAASLSPDEWPFFLATTGNKLDYLSISNALQTLWDDQLGGGNKWHGATSHQHGPQTMSTMGFGKNGHMMIHGIGTPQSLSLQLLPLMRLNVMMMR